MFSSMTQNIVAGSSTSGTQNSTAAPQICSAPYRRSALIHLSAMMPAIDGMNSAAMPMVEKIAPNDVPDQCLFWNQYAPIVSSHEPQMKNWRKFITIRRSFRLTCCRLPTKSPQRNEAGAHVQGSLDRARAASGRRKRPAPLMG